MFFIAVFTYEVSESGQTGKVHLLPQFWLYIYLYGGTVFLKVPGMYKYLCFISRRSEFINLRNYEKKTCCFARILMLQMFMNVPAAM